MRIPTLILGGTGYVAGELLRLILDHPHFELCGIVSDSQPGSAAAEAFSHLAPRLGDQSFMDEAGAISLVCKHPRLAILSAAPHGVSASLIDRLLNAAHQAGTQPRVVDITTHGSLHTVSSSPMRDTSCGALAAAHSGIVVT